MPLIAWIMLVPAIAVNVVLFVLMVYMSVKYPRGYKPPVIRKGRS